MAGELICGTCYQIFFDWDLFLKHIGKHLEKGENANLKEGIEVLKKVTVNEGPISLN